MLSAKAHDWVTIVFNSISLGQFVMVAKRMPIIWPVLPFILPKGFVSQRKRFVELTRQKVLARMVKSNSRDDFFSHMLAETSNDSSEKLMIAQGGILTIAGSETTQTFLTAVTYFLLKYPETLRRLSGEIRGAFSDPEKINDVETNRLLYLFAVIEEGLRLFPPVPEGLPRYSPGAMIDGYYVPEGVGVSFCVLSCPVIISLYEVIYLHANSDQIVRLQFQQVLMLQPDLATTSVPQKHSVPNDGYQSLTPFTTQDLQMTRKLPSKRFHWGRERV